MAIPWEKRPPRERPAILREQLVRCALAGRYGSAEAARQAVRGYNGTRNPQQVIALDEHAVNGATLARQAEKEAA